MNKKIFILGPIQGVETEQSYRDAIRETCIRNDYGVVDPWQREKILYNSTELGWWNRVSATDFEKRLGRH